MLLDATPYMPPPPHVQPTLGMAIEIFNFIDTVHHAQLPAAFGDGWNALTLHPSRMRVGQAGAQGVWSRLIEARPVHRSSGVVTRSAPLPFPIHLSDDEVAQGRLLSLVYGNAKYRRYTATMTLALSASDWEPCLCDGDDALSQRIIASFTTAGAGTIHVGMRMPPADRPGRSTACRVVLTLDELHELPFAAEEPPSGPSYAQGLWEHIVAEWTKTFSFP